jgi:hypothetical protein
MADIQDTYEHPWDFEGPSAAFPTSAAPATPWMVADTSSSGAPTYVRNAGSAVLTLASTSEIENVCLYHGDGLTYDIDGIQAIEFSVKLGAAFTSGSELVFGLGSARNDTTDSVAANAWFKMVGANSTSAVYCESDDGVNDLDDKATGQTLSTSFKRFVIDFTGGKSNVRFLMDNGSGKLTRVAASTTFDMSNYSSGLQPIVQLQKAANTNVDSVTIDYIVINGKRV